MNTALTVSNVSVTFRKRSFFKKAADEHPVLRNISLTVKKGEALGIIGSNGAGKSTLLRIMAGILSPDAGTVESHGMSTALLTLSGGIFPECSGWDNVVMLLMLQQDVSRKEAEALVPSIAEFAELEYAIHAPMRTYSSGMLSRLKFAIAIQANPDVLLVDEVLAVGDAPFATKSMDAMRRKLSSGGTVIFVSHSLYDVYTYCTRAIWIEKGVIMAEGNAKDTVQVYRRYCVAQGAEVFDPSVWAEFWEERKMSGTR